MVNTLPHVNQPIRIGQLSLRNRIFVAAHSTNFAERLSSDRLRAYYVERARGGVGLVIHEPVIVHPTSLSRPTKVWGFDAGNVPHYRRMAEELHEAGAAAFCQVLHNGAHMGGYFTGGPLWAPSPRTDPLGGEPAHEMTVAEITEVVRGFARTAEICREGGFDGVELHGSHGYLVQQFLSPLTNHRTDDYGGDPERRRRFLLDIIDAVRSRVGDDFVVGVRIAGHERVAGGLTEEDACELTRVLEGDGRIDYLNVSTGSSYAQGWVVLDATYARMANADTAAAIKRSTTLPVLVAGRIARPSEAEAVLAAGQADMVGVVRALIADPEWLSKANAGRVADIRPCTYCNECVAGIGTFRAVRCTVNPEMGHEAEAAEAGWGHTAPARRRVVVIGGGVAGMEAALTARRRGHDVVLLEAAEHLGGQLVPMPDTASRVELAHLPVHLADAVTAAGVEVELGVQVDAAAVLERHPDVVVIATGSQPAPPDRTNVVDAVAAADVLAGGTAVGQRVLVTSEDGHPWELDVVLEHLAACGHEVLAVVAGPTLVARGTDAALPARLARMGVRVEPFAKLVAASHGTAELVDVLTGTSRRIDGIDIVVVATPRVVDTALAAALAAGGVVVEVVGDALAPRSVRDAIWEARGAALRIGAPTSEPAHVR